MEFGNVALVPALNKGSEVQLELLFCASPAYDGSLVVWTWLLFGIFSYLCLDSNQFLLRKRQ